MNYLVSILILFTMIGCSSNTREPESDNNVVSQTVADRVITNAKVYLGKDNYAAAIAIKDGKILFLGTEQAAQAYIATVTNVIDAGGQLVLPGFIDNHNHLGEGGEVTCTPSAEYTLSQQAQLLSQCAQNVEPGKWIIGYGSDYLSEMDEQQTTPISVLDDLFPQNPVIIMDFTSHAQFVNSLALEIAEIDKSSPNPI
ncbi:MAG: amidohydrolase family protein, partial [Kangiellaceae bacterium]|nr:amidohydrolase family protein [Kangiellaceae bacterium]